MGSKRPTLLFRTVIVHSIRGGICRQSGLGAGGVRFRHPTVLLRIVSDNVMGGGNRIAGGGTGGGRGGGEPN